MGQACSEVMPADRALAEVWTSLASAVQVVRDFITALASMIFKCHDTYMSSTVTD